MKAGAIFRAPSRVSRSGSEAKSGATIVPSQARTTATLEQLMDHPSSLEHPELGAVGRADPHALQEGRPDHGRCDRLGGGVLAAGVALADDPPGLDTGAGPEREVAGGPVVARADGVDPRGPAKLAHAKQQRRLQQAAPVEVVQQ